MGRCRGAFDPVKSFESLAREQEGINVEVVEVACLNMCKRGPNVRMMYGQDSVTAEGEGMMGDVEKRRKAFQGVGSDERVTRVWEIANGVHGGAIPHVVHGLPQ